MSDHEYVEDMIIIDETPKPLFGEYLGQCKWFSDKLGYGFVTIVNKAYRGKDVFVHHTCIHPLNSKYRTLRKGEYVALDVKESEAGLQGLNLTGVQGGPMMCDFVDFAYTRPFQLKPIKSGLIHQIQS